ncbi:hypothetical protein LSH36_1364g00003 [Paralvinella palmiformis]|uniref:SEFIR domain-containing protein n=1 Tax=Paralvinella palmiformis TaxID=53620 RepID=A0AAD9ISZ6_9ANNE|nr:hypothetical protein LSH36_1364g00003 [Paralvinella palmiformis]
MFIEAMAQALSIIIEAYPELETLYQQDIKFSDISPHIRYEIAKILAVMGEETWQRLGAQIKMSSDDIKYASVLKEHSGDPVLNLFDIYMARYENSLLEIVHSLGKLKNLRLLTKIKELWKAYIKKQVFPRRASYEPSFSRIEQTFSNKKFRHIQRRDTRQAVTIADVQQPVWCLMKSVSDLRSADYDRTRAWVEKHNGLSIKNIPVPVIKEENETPSHCCSESRDALYVQMDRHALAKFNLNQAVSKNYTKNLYPAVDKNELMDDGLTKTGSYGSPRNGFNFQSLASDQSGESSANVTRTKLPPFSASFHKGPPLENKFNPLMPIPHGNCCEPMDTSLPKKNNNLSSSTVSASSNYHTMPLSKTEKKKLGKSPSCTGKMESCPYADSLRNSSVFITHLYRGIHPTDTKSGAYNNKCAISLGYCLKENNFRVQMDVPKQSRVPSNEDWRNWLDRKFSVANFIIVCVTQEYLEVVNSTEIEDSDELMNNVQSTRYIYHLMQHEFEENNGINRRFIPVFFRDPQNYHISFLPNFLQTEGMGPYVWSKDYMDLLWRLDRHDVLLNNINGVSGIN